MPDAEVERAVRVLRIIVAALVMGLVTFIAVAAGLVASGSAVENPEAALPLLVALAGFALAGVPAYVVARLTILKKLRRGVAEGATAAISTDELTRSFTALTIVGCAVAEGASLFAIVILLVTGIWWVLVVPALGIALIVLQAPSRDKFHQFASRATGTHWPQL
jgi:hypothetical protein